MVKNVLMLKRIQPRDPGPLAEGVWAYVSVQYARGLSGRGGFPDALQDLDPDPLVKAIYSQ
ncbi:MAG: hypothetical protein AB7V64_11000 [Methanothrix sp.]